MTTTALSESFSPQTRRQPRTWVLSKQQRFYHVPAQTNQNHFLLQQPVVCISFPLLLAATTLRSHHDNREHKRTAPADGSDQFALRCAEVGGTVPLPAAVHGADAGARVILVPVAA
eukprot:CAMPEP_0178997340 /NCGR_PEP_ID=MMETSP0795-20121207/8868_1 /TAXON_ID=88552 /ORGANISM="Amoebophrya sp., Strain Ameob2" /LENGTH=115 /DNA_ID=CAMNT_0020689827 /DNA_START=883 /DNA_END=1227 /DNA_ORIENTATION=+